MAGAGYKLFATGDVLSASDVNTYIMQQTIMVFANSTARTTALSSVLAEGMVSYLQDTNSLEVYDGTAWVGATGDITGLTAGTGVAITSATGPVPTVAIDTAVVPRLGVANTFTGGVQQITTASAATKGLIVKATASQTANLQEWQDSTGAVLGLVNSIGRVSINSSADPGGSALNVNQPSGGTGITVNGSGTAGSAINVLPAAGSVGLIVKGAASQTADLQQWQNSGGTSVARVTSAGNIATPIVGSLTAGHAYIQTAGTNNAIQVQTNAAANIGLIVIGATSQTANLQQWRNSAGTVIAGVDASGNIRGTSVRSLNDYSSLLEANSGGYVRMTKQTAASPNPGSGLGSLYFRDGTNAGTLKLVVRAGASGAETTILDNIPQ